MTDIGELDKLMNDVKDYSRRARLIVDFIAEHIYTREEYVSFITQLYEPIRKEKEDKKK